MVKTGVFFLKTHHEIIHYTLVTFNRPSMSTHLQFPATIHFLEYHLSAPTISVLPTPTISQCCQNRLPCSTPSSTCAEIIYHKNVASVRFLFSWFSASKFRKKLRLMVFFGRMNFRRSHLRPVEISGCSQQTPVE